MLNVAAAKRNFRAPSVSNLRGRKLSRSGKDDLRAQSVMAFGGTPNILQPVQKLDREALRKSYSGSMVPLLQEAWKQEASVVDSESASFKSQRDTEYLESSGKELKEDGMKWLVANKAERIESEKLDKSSREHSSRIQARGNLVPEQERQSMAQIVWDFSIDPTWMSYNVWQMGMLVVVLYNAIVLPFGLAFWHDETPLIVNKLNTLSDILFWFDLLQNFWCVHIDQYGIKHYEKRRIARAYLSSWFIVDFIACIPLELFLPADLVNASNMIKCIRLLRLSKVMRFLDKFNFGVFLRMMRLIVGVLILCHWIACFWFFTGVSVLDSSQCNNDVMSFKDNSTNVAVKRAKFCSWLMLGGLESDRIPYISKYLKALYWSITTVMTVGYGDYRPINTSEYLFYIVVSVVGAGAYANFFSIIVQVIENSDVESNSYSFLIEEVGSQMHFLKFPPALREKVFKYYDYMYVKQRLSLGDRLPFFEFLPTQARVRIKSDIYLRQIKNVYFMKGCSQNFMQHVAEKIERMACIPSEVLVHEGDHSDAWFVIESGCCAVLKKDKRGKHAVLRLLGAGEQFGEIGLLTGSTRSASVKARTFCDLWLVSLANFYTILGDYKADKNQIVSNCIGFLKQFRPVQARKDEFLIPQMDASPLQRKERRKSSISMEVEANSVLPWMLSDG